METVLLARNAMATRFEVVLHGPAPRALRAAGEEALDEIERIESRLSLFQPTSEIADVNARAAHEPVRVSPEVFRLLEGALELGRATDGAFDITVGPLMRCWGLNRQTGRVPDAEELAKVRQRVGTNLVQLNPENMTVRFDRPGVSLDLGAMGKGYAIDHAVELLREAGVTNAFIHGGTSTAYGMGACPDGSAWKVALDWPDLPQSSKDEDSMRVQIGKPVSVTAGRESIATVSLKNEGVSVSAPSGKSFRAGDVTYGHVIDPRTGMPVTGAVLAAVAMASAMETDALSTALLTVGLGGHEKIKGRFPRARTLVGESAEGGKQLRVRAQGIAVRTWPGLLLID